MRIVFLLLAVVVVAAAGPVTFSGSVGLTGEQEFISNIRGDTLRSPYSHATFNLNPTLSIYGFPISADFLLSSMESDLRQALNKFRFYLDPAMLLQNLPGVPWLGQTLKGVEIGTCNPTWSDLALSGATVNGAAVELNPWYVYAAAAVGRSQRAVEGADTTDTEYRMWGADTAEPAFGRMLYAGKFGFGKKEATHFYVTGMFAKDDPNSLTYNGHLDTMRVDSTKVDTVWNETVTPEENYLAGAELNLYLAEGAVTLESEVSASEHTRDNRMEVMEYDWLPEWISNTFKPRLSSSVDFAYRVKPALNVLDTRLYGEVSMVGPGYTSLGAPSLRNDNLAYGAGISRYFADSQVSASASFRRERDNITVATDSAGDPIETKGTTTWFTSYSLDLGLNFIGIPYVQVGYYPYMQKNEVTDDQTHMFMLSTGHSFMTGQVSHSPGLSFSYQQTKSTTDGASGTVFDVGLYHNVGFEIPLSLSAGLGFGRQNYPDSTGDRAEDNFFVDVSPSYTLFDVWTNTLTLDWASDAGGNSYDVRLVSSFPIWKIADANVGIEQSLFRGTDSLKSSYDNLRLTAGLYKSW